MNRKRGRDALQTLKTVGIWLAVGLVIGTVCGGIGAAFTRCVTLANTLFVSHGWLLWLLPVAGIVIVLLYTCFGMLQSSGTDGILEAVRTGETVRFATAPLIFIGTVLTHLCGGSAGREGAALQLGGSVGALFGKVCRLQQRDRGVAILCGMSALFAALFGTPVTAVFFALEVVSVGVMYYAALLPCLTACLTAFGIAKILGGESMHFSVEMPAADFSALWRTAVLAVLCAGVSILFCESLKLIGKFFRKQFENPFLRITVGGIAVILLTLLCGTRDYNGSGMNVIQRAVAGDADAGAFLWKILFTAVTVGCGFKGGEIVPTLFIGATFGCRAGELLGLNPSVGAAIGMTSVFCGVVNCPVASLALSVELFGANGLLLFAVACAVSYALSGYFSLYHSQHIVYSKLHAEFIDRLAD